MSENSPPPSPLMLHDSLRRATIPFVPLNPDHIRVYFCGPTVYDLPHIGNMRAMLSADILVRILRTLYPKVTFIRNITDVDDKIIIRARENNESISSLTSRTIQEFHEDVRTMGLLPPDDEPRATGYIPQMQEMISGLIRRGHAYVAEGHVLFSVSSFPGYGALSGRDPDALMAGARVEVAPYKHDPGDFVLWKPSASDQPGWDSPWGYGRPGWHIECSAMSRELLGESFDIHGGGSDLLFPHHENERAQSLCCFPESSFANYWLHNAMLLVDGEKMSKSLGNFLSMRDVLSQAPAEALRLFFLGTHYRSTLNFTWSGVSEAKKTLDRFYRALEQHFGTDLTTSDIATSGFTAEPGRIPTGDAPLAAFFSRLLHDLNTPGALAELHHFATKALEGDEKAASSLFIAGDNAADEAQIETLIAERIKARAERDFTRADKIRDELAALNILLEDTSQGTIWRRL